MPVAEGEAPAPKKRGRTPKKAKEDAAPEAAQESSIHESAAPAAESVAPAPVAEAVVSAASENQQAASEVPAAKSGKFAFNREEKRRRFEERRRRFEEDQNRNENNVQQNEVPAFDSPVSDVFAQENITFTPAPTPSEDTQQFEAGAAAPQANENAPAAEGQNNNNNNGQQGDQNFRRFNNNNNQNGNNRFNNNNNNNQNGNNRFNNNKFNKYKNRHNRGNLPQDDFLDESIQLPPPDPEKVAAARAKWKELRGLPMFELQSKAEELGIVDFKKMRKQALVYSILSAISGEDCPIYTEGVLEIIPEGGHGFLRNPEHNYLAGPDDIYISKNIIRRYELKMGDTITGQVRQPREGEKYFALLRIDTVNFEVPEKTKRRVSFEYLTPIHPIERLNLEFDTQEYSTRLMNLFTPIGKGQRSIVLAPPRTGKTVLLQNVTKAITANHPEVKLMVLLIDERPEEVTEMRKLIDRLKEEGANRGKNIMAEVLASTFDEEPGRHIKVASLVLEKAKRLVEHGNDVVILLDSITRFARANNIAIPHSGKILSGGVDANAMQLPKKFFGAARKIENGGSLTIIGTALIETGSRMDEVIFEEFKGTGNMELVLDRRLAEKRTWPAIDIFKSGTRKEDRLLSLYEQNILWSVRQSMQNDTENGIMDKLIKWMKQYKSNADLLEFLRKAKDSVR